MITRCLRGTIQRTRDAFVDVVMLLRDRMSITSSGVTVRDVQFTNIFDVSVRGRYARCQQW